MTRFNRALRVLAALSAALCAASLAEPVRAAQAEARRVNSTAAEAVAVTVFGDRLAQGLAGGLADDHGLAVTTAVDDAAGLAQPDFGTWVDSLRGRVTGPRRPAVAVLLVGSNDRQPIATGTAVLQPSDPAWSEAYGKRVETVAAAFREARVPLVWVGLPNVRNPATSADFVRINGIVRDHAVLAGATVVDSFGAFSDETGAYSAVGPDVDGRTVTLRRADGVAFTRAGARKLASFVSGDIARLAGRPAHAGGGIVADIRIDRPREFDQALDIDINAQIQREAALVPGPGPASRPAEAAPAAGPVISLTAAPLALDGQLAQAVGRAATGPAADTTGSVTVPKRGRADDFSWPRP
ncbi:MAG: DUF459 domain-containing protein [Parafilimonas terrae]|nr:DUF459 domain-containing protein [Parafilimonas terrae]